MENLRRMKIDVASIETIALSHGHLDHYAAITHLLEEMDLLPGPKEWGANVSAEELEEWMEGHRLPVVAHPAALRERWWVNDDGTLAGPRLPPPENVWQALGARIVLSEEPYQLAPGCWTTGYIPRNSFETSGRPERMRYREGSEFVRDDLEDDQAVVINVEGKGLVVLSGCAHSGIVNTVAHAKDFFKIDTIYAVIGGFHLARASDDEIDQTVASIRTMKPSFVIPSHCTGFKAISRFAQQMPNEFIESVVGATYHL
jgi:7,8-dihydropterin-6-yl-methyl-4-(beta-D-ribofuranosyl)aminobenzene 5'-phosphate synthase